MPHTIHVLCVHAVLSSNCHFVCPTFAMYYHDFQWRDCKFVIIIVIINYNFDTYLVPWTCAHRTAFPLKTCTHSPVAAFHTRTVLSRLHVTHMSSSIQYRIQNIRPVWLRCWCMTCAPTGLITSNLPFSWPINACRSVMPIADICKPGKLWVSPYP
jgi:hypothetical protein